MSILINDSTRAEFGPRARRFLQRKQLNAAEASVWVFKGEYGFMSERLRYSPMPATVPGMIGHAVHRRLSDGNTDSTQQYVEQCLAQLSTSEQCAAAKRVEELVETGLRLSGAPQPEVQLRWTDPVTGWEFLGKPDRLEVCECDGVVRMVEPIDHKIGYKLKPEHEYQARFFAMLAGIHFDITGPIKAKVHLLGAGRVETVSCSEPGRLNFLSRLRDTVGEIETLLTNIAGEAVLPAVA